MFIISSNACQKWVTKQFKYQKMTYLICSVQVSHLIFFKESQIQSTRSLLSSVNDIIIINITWALKMFFWEGALPGFNPFLFEVLKLKKKKSRHSLCKIKLNLSLNLPSLLQNKGILILFLNLSAFLQYSSLFFISLNHQCTSKKELSGGKSLSRIQLGTG